MWDKRIALPIGRHWFKIRCALLIPLELMPHSHPNAVRIGPYLLDEAILRGGMGSVWRAVHEATGVRVALKFITSERAKEPRYVRAFRREVEAVARLDHPGIIAVYDEGRVDAVTAALLPKELQEGGPYLVMELASHALSDVKLPLAWDDVRRLLTAILDALAHAHARGVMHRDIKPGNVLFVPGPNGVSQVKLSDFGVSHAIGHSISDSLEGALKGTPAYITPEQLLGSSSDVGPWTDLYSVGVLAYELVTGRLPFHADTFFALVRAHLTAAPEPFDATHLPRGFLEWVLRLMEKSPAKRFVHAADAARAFSTLGQVTVAEVATEDAPAVSVREEFRKTINDSELDDLPSGVSLSMLVEKFGQLASSSFPSRVSGSGEDPPIAVPASWHSLSEQNISTRPLGFGLGLMGVRDAPLVGREAERDAMWEALKEVDYLGRPKVLILRGSSGMGKQRLAQWFVRRVYETGVAPVLSVHHRCISGPDSGMERMVARYMRCVGLDSTKALQRVELFLHTGLSMGPAGIPEAARDWPDDPDITREARALLRLVSRSLRRDQSAPQRFQSAEIEGVTAVGADAGEQRYRLLTRFMERV